MAVIYSYFLTIIALLFAANLAHRSRYVNKYKNRFFMVAVFVNIVLLASEMGRAVAELYGWHMVHMICQSINFAFAPLMPYSITLMNRKCWGKSEKRLLLPAIPIMFLAASNWRTGWLFYFDEFYRYHRGHFYGMSLLVSLFYFTLLLVTSFREYREAEREERNYLAGVLFVAFAGIMLQVFFSRISSMWTTCGICLLLYYTFELEMCNKYDGLTGVRNRIAFESSRDYLGKGADYILVLFDVNGLKVMNDEQGHEQGDKLIMGIARLISDYFYGIGRVYRIGGDEFCVLCENTGVDKVRVALSNLEYGALRMSRRENMVYSVSYGLAHHGEGSSSNFQEIFNEADGKMYQMKAEYYKQTGKDRRKKIEECEKQFRHNSIKMTQRREKIKIFPSFFILKLCYNL